MSLGTARSIALQGLVATDVTVEAHVGNGLPGFTLLGGRGTPFAQAADRAKAALAAVGIGLSTRKVVVNLAPADADKRGARFDLAIVVAILRALEELPPGEEVLLGELALDGQVRAVRGVLPSLRGRPRGAVLVPADNVAEAQLAAVPQPLAVARLAEVIALLRGSASALPNPPLREERVRDVPDLADVVGQGEARRAVEVAAAGGHHLLLLGPPGAGKSMLARRLPGVLPDLPDAEAMQVASIRSIAGRPVRGLDRRPPFAAPHHSSSGAALLGGGSGVARPGAVSQASHGVLFLDELFEWRRNVLDGLREPLEEGQVRIARSAATVRYPARVLLVAAGNLCPCGPTRDGCRCRPDQVERYRARLTGPLADRFDLAPLVEPVPAEALGDGRRGEATAPVRDRVAAARAVALARFGTLNASAPTEDVRQTLDGEALRVLVQATDAGRLSARGFHRAMRVARTCADLAGNEVVQADDALEAVAHRGRLDALWDVAA